MLNSDVIYNIIVICSSLDEFKDFIANRKEILHGDELVFLGPLARIYLDEYTGKDILGKAQKRFKTCYVFHWPAPGKAAQIGAVRIDSWEAWGTGDKRIDFELVVKVCKDRWTKLNPVARRDGSVKPFYLQGHEDDRGSLHH